MDAAIKAYDLERRVKGGAQRHSSWADMGPKWWQFVEDWWAAAPRCETTMMLPRPVMGNNALLGTNGGPTSYHLTKTAATPTLLVSGVTQVVPFKGIGV